MAAKLAWLKEHRRTILLVAIGTVIVMTVSVSLDSTKAVVIAGVGAGVVVGLAIASRKDE